MAAWGCDVVIFNPEYSEINQAGKVQSATSDACISVILFSFPGPGDRVVLEHFPARYIV